MSNPKHLQGFQFTVKVYKLWSNFCSFNGIYTNIYTCLQTFHRCLNSTRAKEKKLNVVRRHDYISRHPPPPDPLFQIKIQ